MIGRPTTLGREKEVSQDAILSLRLVLSSPLPPIDWFCKVNESAPRFFQGKKDLLASTEKKNETKAKAELEEKKKEMQRGSGSCRRETKQS